MNIEDTYKFKIPKVSEGKNKYLKAIKKIISQFKINLLIPCTNYDLEILSLNKKYFEKSNCLLSISSSRLIQNLLNKEKAYFLCRSNNINVPKTYSNIEEIYKSRKRNFIRKEKFGHSSRDIKIINNPKKKDFNKNYIIQDYIKGNELHFDILNDFQGKFVTCCVKKKISMLNGETDKAITIFKKKYINSAKKISKAFKHIGNLDCDAILDKNKKIYFIDFNPRFGGGYPFTHLSGFNFLEMIVNKFSKKNYKILKKPKIVKCSKGISIQVVKN